MIMGTEGSLFFVLECSTSAQYHVDSQLNLLVDSYVPNKAISFLMCVVVISVCVFMCFMPSLHWHSCWAYGLLANKADDSLVVSGAPLSLAII